RTTEAPPDGHVDRANDECRAFGLLPNRVVNLKCGPDGSGSPLWQPPSPGEREQDDREERRAKNWAQRKLSTCRSKERRHVQEAAPDGVVSRRSRPPRQHRRSVSERSRALQD